MSFPRWKFAISHVQFQTDGPTWLKQKDRSFDRVLWSLTAYESAIIYDILNHNERITRVDDRYVLRGRVLSPDAVGELLGTEYLEEQEDGSISLSGLLIGKLQLYGADNFLDRIDVGGIEKSPVGKATWYNAVLDKQLREEYEAQQRLKKAWGPVLATKDEYEREEEEVEKMVTPSPKHRAPRRDLEKNTVEDKDTRDESKKDKDLSLNYKDSAWRGWSVVAREDRGGLPDWAKGKTFTHPATKNRVDFRSLPPDEQARLREEHDKKNPPPDEDEALDPTTMVEDPNVDPEANTVDTTNMVVDNGAEPEPAAPKKEPVEPPEGLSGGNRGKLEKALKKFSPEQQQEFRKSFDEQVAEVAAENPTATAAYRKEVEEFERGNQDLDPAALARAMARAEFFHKVADNPLFDAANPLPGKDDTAAPDPQELRERGEAAIAAYEGMDAEQRREHYARIQTELDSLPEKSARRKHLETVARGIALVSAVEDGDKARGVASSVVQLAKVAHKSGHLGDLLGVEVNGSASIDNQAVVRKIYENLSDEDWESVIDEQHPARPLLDVLNDPEKGRFLSPADKESVRQHLTDLMLAETAFLGANEEDAVGADAPVSERAKWSKQQRLKAAPKSAKFDTKDTMVDWLKSFIKSLSRAGKRKKGSLLDEWKFCSSYSSSCFI